MPGRVDREQVLPLLSALQTDIDNWYASSQAELNGFQRKINDRLARLRQPNQHNSSSSSVPAASDPREYAAPSTPPPTRGRGGSAVDHDLSGDADWSIVGNNGPDAPGTPPHATHRDVMGMSTPTGSPQASDRVPLEQLLARIAVTNNAPPLNFDTLYEQLAGDSPNQNASAPLKAGGDGGASGLNSIPVDSLMHIQGQAKTASVQLHRSPDQARPTVVAIEGSSASDDAPHRYNIDPVQPCQVLVEFKRKRVLQFDSRQYVAPGEYVVVGGDRGEDLGVVIYTWCETTNGKVQGIGLTGSSLTRSIGVGSGKVLRVATPFEVSQLHGIQTELERRAIDVCQQRVLDHALPMVIVDAEYQFDNKKLTFFYEAQQRLDFRELVRDLFKTFRARIWMELAVRE